MTDQSISSRPPELTSICAIGASAGGVAALQKLFSDLPIDLGLAYIVVLHLPLGQPSVLHELLASCTSMQAWQVTDSAELRPDEIYVIAPDRELTVAGNKVAANPFGGEVKPRAPVDTLFRSLASERGEGIAVVMTGAGQDGSHGARALKESGGIVLVQDPADADYPSMPQSVIDTGAADVVEPLARIAGKIGDLARSKHTIVSIDDDNTLDSVRRILAAIQKRTGHDFSKYKFSTILRRVRRRAQLCRYRSISDYAKYAINNLKESNNLFNDFLISVTSFFRDGAAFEVLEQDVIRNLFAAGSRDLRVWTVGCASGEEAYSVAIVMLEEAERLEDKRSIQVFATDLDEDALSTARFGIYPRSIEHDVSPQRLKRFFVDEGAHYRVCRELRDIVLFAAHSVIRDPPFTRLDLIVCRNVTIYFDRHLQQQVSALFHYALNAGGYLFLGSAELPDMSEGLYDVVDREARIYRAGSRRISVLPLLPKAIADLQSGEARHRAPRRVFAGDLLGTTHLAALEAHAPPSVLVDREGRILNLSPNAGRFLLLPGGPLSEKLPALVRPELRGELVAALDAIFQDAAAFVARPVDVSFESEKRQVFLYAARLAIVQGAADRALICFLDGGPSGQAPDSLAMSNPQQAEIRQLRADLSVAQQSALASRAEHDSALQDLRVANEELQSLNEEYRSTAEELETSKEELQSVNEELQTVNAELKKKVQVISSAHNDLLNLTTSSEIGTLFLDPDLKIRMFTPPIAGFFSVSDVDVGRSITDFAHRLEYDRLELDVRDVLNGAAGFEAEIKGPQGRWLLLRIRPYRTTDARVSGVVVTFNDITDRKREIALEESEARFKAFVTASFDVIYRMSADWSEMIQLEGRSMLVDTSERSPTWMKTYILPDDRADIQAAIDKSIRDKSVFELEHRVRRRDGSLGWTRSRAVPILDKAGDIVEWIGTAIDVTALHAASAALQNSEERLQRALDIVPTLISEADQDGNIVLSNAGWSTYTGLKLEQLRNFGWLDAIHPDEVGEAKSAFMQAFASDKAFHREQRIRGADGTYRLFSIRHTPSREPGGPTNWYGAAMDIDHLRPEAKGRKAD